MTFIELSDALGFGAPWEFAVAIFAVVVGVPAGLLLRRWGRRR